MGALKPQLIPTDESLWDIKNFKHFLESRRQAIAGFRDECIKELDYRTQEESQQEKVYDQTPYGIVKSLETQLRLFIERKLSSKSAKWWIQRVPEDVRTNAETRYQKNDKQRPWYENNTDPDLLLSNMVYDRKF